jgi:hypothetical protein
MRLRWLDRIRWLVHPRRSRAVPGNGQQGRHRREQQPADSRVTSSGLVVLPAAEPSSGAPDPPGAFAPGMAPVAEAPFPHRTPPSSARWASGPHVVPAGAAQARVREAPDQTDPIALGHAAGPAAAAPGPPPRAYDPLTAPDLARAAAGIPQQSGADGRPSRRAARAALRMKLPFTAACPHEWPRSADGRRNCGSLENILWRQWDAAVPPPAQVVEAIDRLAELPEPIKAKLAAGLDAIFVGPGGVPELDEMGALQGVRLPSGQASWDACAGAYGERKIVVGSRPSPTPDVMCHEIGHALDDLDSPPGKWQSDSAEFRMLYDQCQPHLASDFHRQPGGLGRKEFFADAFAAIASSQRPALVDMLSGDTRTALRVMLYFNRRYGI